MTLDPTFNDFQGLRPAVRSILAGGHLAAEVENLRIAALTQRLLTYNGQRVDVGRLSRYTVLLNRTVREAGRSGVLSPQNQEVAKTLAVLAEQLAEIDSRNRGTIRMIAAVAWELAGFQANAATLARVAAPLNPEDEEWTLRELTSAFLQRRFIRLRLAAQVLKASPRPEALNRRADASEFNLVIRAGAALAADGLANASRFMMRGTQQDLLAASDNLLLARDSMSDIGASTEANLIDGLLSLLPRLETTATWTNLAPILPHSRLWNRYLQVLGRGIAGQTVLEARSISELWPSQMAAISQGLFERHRARIVRMPTSAGKTRVAEMAIVHSLATKPGSRALYVAPFNALVDEVEASFTSVFGDLGIGVSTLVGAYDTGDIDQSLTDDDELLIVTPEKLDQIMRQAPEILESVSIVVLDEGHLVGEPGRGPKYELAMTRLRRRLPEVSFLALSAVVPNQTLQDFATWLGTTDGVWFSSSWRPTVLRLARLDWTGSTGNLVYPDEKASPLSTRTVSDGLLPPPANRASSILEQGLTVSSIIQSQVLDHIAPETGRRRKPSFPESNHRGQVCSALAWQLVDEGPVLVFCMLPDHAIAVSKALLNRIRWAELRDEIVPRSFIRITSRSAIVAEEWLGPDHDVTIGLRRGIAVHYANLPGAVRNAVEQDLRDRRIKLLIATSTLAQGVNLPVRTVIVHSTRRYDPELATLVRMPARDFWNIAGRVGRAGAETEGTVVFLNMNENDLEDFEHFRTHRDVAVEPVTSALLEQLRNLVQNRISDLELARKLDPEVLALLVEESIDALTVEGLQEILGGSLFAIQGANEQVGRLYSNIAQTARVISDRVTDLGLQRLYASTGLSARSCLQIQQHVDANGAALISIFNGIIGGEDADGRIGLDLDSLLHVVLEGLGDVSEMEPPAGYSGSPRELLRLWMNGVPVSDIAVDFETDPVSLSSFIEGYFGYKLPWGFAGYLKIAAASLSISTLPNSVAALPSIIRYGVPTTTSSWAMTLGIPSRGLATRLASWFEESTDVRTPRTFRKWLFSIDPDVLIARLGVSGFALEQTANVIGRAQRSEHLREYYAGRDLFPIDSFVTSSREARDSGLASNLSEDIEVFVRRDYDTALNRNAVLLSSWQGDIGRIDRDTSVVVAVLMDIGYSLDAQIVEVLHRETSGTVTRLRVRVILRDEPSAPVDPLLF